MNAPQRNIAVSSWLEPDKRAAEITVWPFTQREAPELHRSLRDRVTLAVYIGAATVQLRPTIAEAHALIEALEWAIAHSEVPA